MPSARFVTSSASANCGSSLGGTNEHTSMSRTPAATSALIQASFRSVGTTVLMFWMPSRRPTSRTSINSAIVCLLIFARSLAFELRLALFVEGPHALVAVLGGNHLIIGIDL